MDLHRDAQPNAPLFLRILCYLTIFGSSYMLISSISALANLDQTVLVMSESMARIEELFGSAMQNQEAGAKKLEQIMDDIRSGNNRSNMRDHHVFTLICNILTLVGANFMLRRKRTGFRLYLLGTVLGVVTPLLVFGTGNFLGFAYALTGAIFGGLFVLLYALKIKHME